MRRPMLVAVTGCEWMLYRQRSAEAGIDLHLIKPVSLATVQKVPDRFLQVISPPAAVGERR
jgi:hypothetical protein